MDPYLGNMLDFYDNLNHINSYVLENPKFLCIGNEKGLCCEYLKEYHLEDFIGSSIVTLPDEQVNYLDPKFYQPFLDENGQFNLVFLSCLNKERVLDLITNIIKQITPEVIIIDRYKEKLIFDSIYQSSDLFTKYNYILEIVNSQYVLVRRDCYSKKV